MRRRAPEALAGLHEQYADGIYNLALRVVRHASDAEDITHDVLIRAYERLPRDREVLLRPWLYRLTLNRCYDHLRWASRRSLVAQEREAPSPHDPYEQSELQALLEASLGDLTRRQRAAILLKDVHGLSLAEVAACLDLTPGSVEVLLARARRAFRASFETRSAAAGRPLPGSAGALAALPLLPLPLGLSAPPLALPAAPVPIPPLAPLAGGPLAAATGGGIGALLGLPSSIKTAVLVAATAASLGSAELVANRADQRPPRPQARVAAATATESERTSAVELSASHATSRPAAPSAAPRASDLSPSPAASTSSVPSSPASPLGIITPSASPSPSDTPEAAPSATSPPDPHATTPSPSPPATPSASPSPSPDAGDSASPSPAAGL